MFSQIDLIAPQDHISSNRYLDLGYRKDKLKVTGNIKYDLSITDELREKIDALRALWVKNRPIWVAASTHEGEEKNYLTSTSPIIGKIPKFIVIARSAPSRAFLMWWLIYSKRKNFNLFAVLQMSYQMRILK